MNSDVILLARFTPTLAPDLIDDDFDDDKIMMTQFWCSKHPKQGHIYLRSSWLVDWQNVAFRGLEMSIVLM